MTTTDDELPRSGPIWTPHASAKDWTPPPGTCSAAARGKRFHPVRCGRVAKVKRRVLDHAGNVLEVEYCGTHDPVKVREKNEAREKAWQAKWDAREASRREADRRLSLRNECLEAIKEIARGHNDPRSLALEILQKHSEEL